MTKRCIDWEGDIWDKDEWSTLEECLRAEDVFSSKQVAGTHYQLPIEPIDYIYENHLGYMEGNVIKYVTRHESKNGKQDLLKAIHYLEMLIARRYPDENDIDDNPADPYASGLQRWR